MGRAMKFRVIIGMLAVCGMAQVTGISMAAETSFSLSNNQAAISHIRPDGVTWGNAGAADFQALMGDNFTLKTHDNRLINVKLVNVVAGVPDINRPSFLPRKHSIVAVLKPSKSDAAWLAKSGSQVLECWHHELGNGRVLINAIKKREGSYSIEFVLN